MGNDQLALLGKWGVLDIETTGIHPDSDDIIDIGFLLFEGLELKHSFSSLVHSAKSISHYIQKLTGIITEELKEASTWEELTGKISLINHHTLLAHNADFEERFLKKELIEEGGSLIGVGFEDTMGFLGLLWPQRDRLNLDSFIVEYGLADREAHRGYQDSLDLLKVLLISFALTHHNLAHYLEIKNILAQYHLLNSLSGKLFQLGPEGWKKLAGQLDLDLDTKVHELIQRSLPPSEVSRPRPLPKDKEASKKEVSKNEQFSLLFSGENIRSILRDVGRVRERLPHYIFRESQESLSIRVGQSLKNKVHALIQAPTGTGKTLGYLLPTALFALAEKKQVLVATATKTLQHQALSQDIPHLRTLLELDEQLFKVARLIGSSNHLCEWQFRKKVEEEASLFASEPYEERFIKAFFDLVFLFNSRQSPHFLTKDDLSFALKRKMPSYLQWEKDISVDYRTCLGNNCPFQGHCSYIQGLREAKEADLIIGNHALMFSWPRGFPRPEYVVVDEAHKIEGEATKTFTLSLAHQDLEALIKGLEHWQGVGALFYLLSTESETGNSNANAEIIHRLREDVRFQLSMLKDHVAPLPELVETFFKRTRYYQAQYWNELPLIKRASSSDSLSQSIYNHYESIHQIIKGLYMTFVPYLSMWEKKELKDENKLVSYSRFELFMAQLEDMHKVLEEVMSGGGSGNGNGNGKGPEDQTESAYVHSLKYHEEFGPALEAAPLDIGRKVHEGLLATSSAVVFTSATLGGEGEEAAEGGIGWASGHIYLDPSKRFKNILYLPSSYDYKRKSKVFLCDDTPALSDRNFVPRTCKDIIPLVENLGGRSLLLYSSRVRFEEAREILLEHFEGKIPLFIQGLGQNVVEEFKKSSRGILLGMESFGEGIDVPGDSLQFIFIDKIPDMRMDLVLKERRNFFEKNFGQEFVRYFLSYRARSLHQKLGRLLRTETDFGGAIIVDSRIRGWKKKTQEEFQKLMSPYEVRRTTLADACQGVLSFIKEQESGSGDRKE